MRTRASFLVVEWAEVPVWLCWVWGAGCGDVQDDCVGSSWVAQLGWHAA